MRFRAGRILAIKELASKYSCLVLCCCVCYFHTYMYTENKTKTFELHHIPLRKYFKQHICHIIEATYWRLTEPLWNFDGIICEYQKNESMSNIHQKQCTVLSLDSVKSSICYHDIFVSIWHYSLTVIMILFSLYSKQFKYALYSKPNCR